MLDRAIQAGLNKQASRFDYIFENDFLTFLTHNHLENKKPMTRGKSQSLIGGCKTQSNYLNTGVNICFHCLSFPKCRPLASVDFMGFQNL